MKQFIRIPVNFCKHFALSTKSKPLEIDSFKIYLKQNIKLAAVLISIIGGLILGPILSYLDYKMHGSMFILTLIYTTLKPMGWTLIGLMLFTAITPFCITSSFMSNICEGVGLFIEKGIQKVNMAFLIYLFLFLICLFDSYIIFAFIYNHANHYLYLLYLVTDVTH